MAPSVTFTSRMLNRWARLAPAGAADACWPWQGRCDDKGYGFIKFGNDYTTRVHRVAWVLAHGSWPPEGRVVRHTCDNPPCVNPRHLKLGTVADNVRDCVERGRRARGESLRQSKITEEDVRVIRRQAAAGQTRAEIGAAFGLTPSGVTQVVNRKTWAHVL